MSGLTGYLKRVQMQSTAELYEMIADIVRKEAHYLTMTLREKHTSYKGIEELEILPLPTFFVPNFTATAEGVEGTLKWIVDERQIHYLKGKAVIEAPNLRAVLRGRVTSTLVGGDRLTLLAGGLHGTREIRTMLVDSLDPANAVVFVEGVILNFKNGITHGEGFKQGRISRENLKFTAIGSRGRRKLIEFPTGGNAVSVMAGYERVKVVYHTIGDIELIPG